MPGSPGETALPARARGRAAARLAIPALLGFLACARAAETPLLSLPAPTPAAARPEVRAAVAAVESAVQAGLVTVAESLGADALAKLPAGADAARRVRIALADARLQRAAFADAEKVLNEIPGSAPDKSLRLGLAAVGRADFASAGRHLAEARRGTLSAADGVWLEILGGFVAAQEGRANAVEQHLNGALAKTQDPLTRAQIALLRVRMRMRIRSDDTDTLDDIGKIIDIAADPRQAFRLVKLQAFRLAREGKNTEAAARLKIVPVADADLVAERDLLVGLFAGRTDGRPWLVRAVGAEGYPEIQHAALAALRESVVSAAPGEIVPNANGVYNALTVFIGNTPSSRVGELVNYTRAAVQLAAARASEPAERAKPLELAAAAIDSLLSGTAPGALRADALALAADIAWQSGSYRRAADALVKLVDTVPASESGPIRLFAADCYFLQKDFAPAADGYAKARPLLRDAADRGEALIGEVRSMLADGNKITEAARAATGAAIATPAVPEAARLRAEWLVADAQRSAGDHSAALVRTNTALAATPANDAGMRVRFLWLRAMIELDSGKSSAAASSAAELARLVDPVPAGAPAEIADNAPAILAQTSLLKARALLGSAGHDNTGKNFADLRERFPKQPSSAASYLVEGRYLVDRGDLAGALEVFKTGYELFKDDPKLVEYATSALYEAGQTAFSLADRRGKKSYQESFDLFDKLTKKHPDDPRFFSARLMQGDILRSMNKFDDALLIYKALINSRPNDPDRIRAELGKADCLYEQGSGDERSAAALVLAAAEYERLFNLPGRRADLAAEVAFKRADAVSKSPTTGEPDPVAGARIARNKAAAGLWAAVDTLLGSPAESAALTGKGRFWIAKSLLLVSELHRQNGDLRGARAALRRLVDYNTGTTDGTRRLPGATLAQERLEKLSKEPAPPASLVP